MARTRRTRPTAAVPSQYEREVIQEALEKVRGENAVRKAIEEGMSAREAFERYGII